jgi:hypothetical protein
MILGEPVCQRCQLRFRRAPKTCPGCHERKVLAFYDAVGRPACAACTGAEPIYGCRSCGREDSIFGRRCGPCVLAERAAALLADPTGRIHPQLQPVFDAFMDARRPQSVLYWLTHSVGPDILSDMAKGRIEISHSAFEQLPGDKATRYIHELLAAVGVLSPFHARLEQMTPWLTETLASLPKEQADIIGRFAKWQVLRSLRRQAERGKLTPSSIEKGRATIVTVVRFLAWLESRATTLATATQADLERYLVAFPGRGEVVAPFITWASRAKLTAGIETPKWQRGPPQVVLSDDDRWAQVELLLHDQSILLYVRVAGLFTLLFAQPLTRICRMRADQISRSPKGEKVTVNFDTFPIELPEPLDELVVEQLGRQGQASYASRADPWLFPGGTPGKHLSTESIRSHLVERGIQPSDARKAAMFQLAAEMPTPILADILGLATNTSVRWATLAARDWSYYTSLRLSDRGRQAATVTDMGASPRCSSTQGTSPAEELR